MRAERRFPCLLQTAAPLRDNFWEAKTRIALLYGQQSVIYAQVKQDKCLKVDI